MKTFAERLVWARNRKGLTQGELAEKAKVSQSTIGNLEAGLRNTARKVAVIAHILEVDTLWLSEGKGPAPVSVAEIPFPEKDDGKEKQEKFSKDIAYLTASLIEIYGIAGPEGRKMIFNAVQDFKEKYARSSDVVQDHFPSRKVLRGGGGVTENQKNVNKIGPETDKFTRKSAEELRKLDERHQDQGIQEQDDGKSS